MSTMEERMQILKMIENNKITAEQGSQLLSALEEANSEQQFISSPGRAKWFRVRVTDMHSGKHKVNVNIPMGLVNVGMRMGARFAPEVDSVDIQEIMQAVKQGAQGKILDVEDAEHGERVEIYVE